MTEKKLTPADALIQHTILPSITSMEKLWPKDLAVFDPARWEKQIKLAIMKNPDIALCEPASVLESVCQAAELGLDPSGALGSAWLVPYGGKCQLVPGYRGLIDLAHRAGVVRAVDAWVVREKDSFSYTAGTMPKHKPYIPRPEEEQDAGKVWAAWALAVMPGGAKKSTVMSLQQLEAVRARSKARKGPWNGSDEDRAEMQKKTVLRRMLKTVPMSPVRARALARAIELEDASEAEEPEEKELNDAPKAARKNGAASRVEAQLGIEDRPAAAEKV